MLKMLLFLQKIAFRWSEKVFQQAELGLLNVFCLRVIVLGGFG